MWDNRGTNNISVTHTLRVPAAIQNSYDFDEIRIKKITYSSPLNTMSSVNTYENKFYDTFFYKSNGGESDIKYKNNLSTINKNAVEFDYDNDYKDSYDAIKNGFEVSWNADYVSSQCTRTFNVTNKYTGAYDTNLCGYGIVYEVTWEIRR